jgi:hypothetical protein
MDIGSFNNYIGRYLEDQLLKKIISIGEFDEIYTERDLIKGFGFRASSIDFMLTRKNQMIFIQLKWRKTRRRENHGINNFLNSVEYLTNILGRDKYSFGVWSSRIEPFEDNKSKLRAMKIYSINSIDNIQSLVEKTEQFIISKIRSSI